MTPDQILATFESMSELYIESYLDANRRAYPAFETDPWTSLQFFLWGYAFERQGRSPDYSPAAVDAIATVLDCDFTPETVRRVWRAFEERIGRDGLNHANNPLCPRGEAYQRQYRGQTRDVHASGQSAIEFVAHDLQGQCIVTWAQHAVSHSLFEAHCGLKTINGISDKISSFFLRDVATLAGDLQPDGHRALLQPIDVWVRYVAQYLANDNRLPDAACAQFIVDHAAQPERANQGIWYFCAQAAGSSKYWVRRSLADADFRHELIRRHMQTMAARAEAVSNFASRQGISL
jgi:hypothetical protein